MESILVKTKTDYTPKPNKLMPASQEILLNDKERRVILIGIEKNLNMHYLEWLKNHRPQ